MLIKRNDLRDAAKREAFVEKRLNDMAIGEPRTEWSASLRAAAKRYYLKLIQEYFDNNQNVVLNEYLTAAEGSVYEYAVGYEAGYKASLSQN